MATNKAEFKKLAKELLEVEFKDFTEPAFFSNADEFDYNLQISSGVNFTVVFALKETLVKTEYERDDIRLTDIKLLVQFDELAGNIVSPDFTKCQFSGLSHDVVSVDTDAADAIVTIIMREK